MGQSSFVHEHVLGIALPFADKTPALVNKCRYFVQNARGERLEGGPLPTQWEDCVAILKAPSQEVNQLAEPGAQKTANQGEGQALG